MQRALQSPLTMQRRSRHTLRAWPSSSAFSSPTCTSFSWAACTKGRGKKQVNGSATQSCLCAMQSVGQLSLL